jgi:N-acetylglucosaminyl-diphospho-decaprenol L-rhamnosyltransferase
MPGMAELSVYLIHWNAPEWCLSAVRSILASSGVRVSVVVVDNATLTNEQAAVLRAEGARVIRLGRNTGFSGAANTALRDWLTSQSTGEFCVIGSHDLHVQAGALLCLVATAQVYPEYGIIAPALTSPHAIGGGRWTGRRADILPLGDQVGLVECDWVCGACLLLRRRCVEQVGQFDERFGSYVEDVDYCLRARDLGWRVGVCMEARAWGLGAVSSQVSDMVYRNTLLLRVKRNGYRALMEEIPPLIVTLGRTCVGSVAPWRSATRRGASRAFLRSHVRTMLTAFDQTARIVRSGTICQSANRRRRVRTASSP